MNRIKVKITLGVTIILFIIILIVLLINLENKHRNEINKIISAEGGNIGKITKSNGNNPFNEKGSANTIYKIIYTVQGQEKVAWYRAINNIGNIHQVVKSSYEEKWIFE